MKRILETEAMDNLQETQELDKMSQKYIYILNEAMARSALKMGVAKGKVLEIGIGPARIATRLVTYNPQFSVIGIDLSTNMLNIAKNNIKDANIDETKIILIKSDAKKLPFKNESFDLVISQNMLHHLPDPVLMLSEINRVVKNTGAILIRDVIRPPNKLIAKIYSYILGLNYTNTMRIMYYESMLAAFSINEIKSLLNQAGLNNIKITRHFLTHFGIEKASTLNQNVNFISMKLDLLRELMLISYISRR